MRWLMALVLAATVTFGGPALTATPYEFKQNTVVNVSILVCDMLSQTQDILNSWRDGGWAGYLEAKNRLNNILNVKGDVICGIMAGVMIPIGTHGTYDVINGLGHPGTMYLIRFVLPDNRIVFAVSPYPLDIGTGAKKGDHSPRSFTISCK